MPVLVTCKFCKDHIRTKEAGNAPDKVEYGILGCQGQVTQ